APSSPNHAVIALVPAEHEWQPVFHVSNQVVLYNPRSHALSIRKSNNFPERLRGPCPYCKQPLPAGFEPDVDEEIDALDSDPAYHSRASDYFQLLAIANETSSRPSTPPPVTQERSAFPAEKMAEGYFKAFFQEEMKLGMGANGFVLKSTLQHMLDGNPLEFDSEGSGHFAVKKIAVAFGPKVPTLQLRELSQTYLVHQLNDLQCSDAMGRRRKPRSLDDFIDVRLGRPAQHIHIDPLAQFTFPDSPSPSTSHISPADIRGPPIISTSLGQDSPFTGDQHSRSARIRAFRLFQHATPDERDRIQREMAGARANKRPVSWKAVHLFSAEEVKSLFQDVAIGLEFLHNKSILHLDLKPGNVLLTWDEGKLIPRAMLSDFGTSRDMLQSSRNRSGNTGTLTLPSSNSLEYTSPESLPSPVTGYLHQIDSKADMWSLGMILHKLLFFRLPYRYAAEGDANGESISTDRESDKLERLEKEVLSYPGFKSTTALVTTFEARHLPRSFLVLLESLLNVSPSSRPSCERVANAIKDGKLDPLKDDFLHTNGASSVAIRRPDSFGHVPLPPIALPDNSHESESESHHRVEDELGEQQQEDGQTTPTRANMPSPVAPFTLEEKAHLLGPPSPPPSLLTDPAIEVLARHSVQPFGAESRVMWEGAFKSCVLVAKPHFSHPLGILDHDNVSRRKCFALVCSVRVTVRGSA
ncbi:hypothetical protein DXG01_000989, partial [Tephrocybe rancida]